MKKIIFAALFLVLAGTLTFAAGSSEKESKDLSGRTLNVSAKKENLRQVCFVKTEKLKQK